MLNLNPSKKRGSTRNSTAGHNELDGIAQILEQSRGHLSNNFDPDKIRRTYTLPTNTFGEIEFTGLNQSAKFTRLSNTTPEINIQNILQSKWELTYPTLVISIFGGDFEKKRKLKMIIKKGLWKAAESAGCWIVTEGLNMGIMKLAGEAVRDYTDAYGGNKMIAIGVAPWHKVAKNEVLENALYQGTYPAIYQSEEEPEDNEEGIVIENKKEKSLDTNHSHFLLFDVPPSNDPRENDVQFRSRFEHAISFWKSETLNNETSIETRVPICGLVVGGDVLTLSQICHSIVENKCPVVLCQGSSGAADIISLSLDAAQKFELEQVTDDGEIVPLEARLETIIRECLQKINPEITDFKKESLQLKEVVTNYSHLVSVFDMEEDWDLDGYIISSLLSSAGSDLNKNQLNLEQLEITLTLNRADIAKEKIFLENKKWKKGDLNEYMFNALMSDRHEFVKLFLEQGFSLEEFLTVYVLEKLYTEQLKKMNSRIEIFQRLWDNYKTSRTTSNVKLREVGKVIKTLIGDFYHPLYLSKEFQSLLLKSNEEISNNVPSIKITKTKLDQKGNLQNDKQFYENNALEDDSNNSRPDLGTIRSESEQDENVSKDINESIDDFNYQICKERRKNLLRRASSLDMISILKENKISQMDMNDIYNSDVDGVILRTKNNKKVNDIRRRISSLDFSELDEKIASDSKSSDSSVISKKALLKKKQKKNNNQSNMDEFDDQKLKKISLERPARELMIWSLLVGKLQMAELFWTMEKEQIAAALLASMMLVSLAHRTDDYTDKEDYETYSKHFEGQAEGVLNECYIEDEKRAQLLINKKLKYYGKSSVILLAAQGESIKFIAHPCCQDFLNSIWYGDLSSKNSAVKILGNASLGLFLPFFIPKLISYKEDEILMNTPTKPQENHQNGIISDNAKEDIEIGSRLNIGKTSDANLLHLKILKYFIQLKGFYFSPIVRYIYHAVSYITFLLLFSTFLLFKFKVEFVVEEIILTFWIATLLLEEIKQIFTATFSGISFSTYFSDGWNKLDSSAITFYVIAFILRLIVYINNKDNLSDLNQQYHIILTNNLFIGSQTCMGVSLFLFYVRLMYIFTFHIALGPKLIMIRKMISNDLVPFMIILSVFMIGYGVTAYANAYPLGLQFSDAALQNTSSQLSTIDPGTIIFTILLKSYYPMFGEFGLDAMQGNSQSCNPNDPNLVPTLLSRTLLPLFMGFFVLLTNILLFNLLIAMFTKTYEEIESSSVYYWNYQRYQMIAEFVKKSPIIPPFIIVWHFYETYMLLRNKYLKLKNDGLPESNTDPFCVNLYDDMKKERELVKWEHMKATDFLRKLNEPTQKTRQNRTGDSRSLVFRGFGSGGAAQNALAPQASENKVDFTSLIEELNHQFDKRFKEVDVKLCKLSDLESQIGGIFDLIKDLNSFLSEVQTRQEKIIDKIDNVPKCQCTEMVKVENMKSNNEEEEITKLEMAVRSAIKSLKSEFEPLIVDFIASSKREAVEIDSDENEHSFYTSDDIGDSNKDPFFAPPIEDALTGRLIERIVNNHRIWRYVPFNFEMYPGMRMKVPNNMVAWQIPYPDYNAYDASEEVLLYPNQHCRDEDDPAKYKNYYNKFDQANKMKRYSMLGQYALDPVTSAPLNPTGRTGLKGRGLLPHWGPNHSIIILFTRWSRTDNGSPIHRKNKRMMQYIALERSNRIGIPWFLVDHIHGCDLNECSSKTILSYLDHRLDATFSGRKLEFIRKKVLSATCTLTFKGFLDDHLNADHAWIETVVVNFQESEKFLFTDDLLRLFNEENSPETVQWMDLKHCVNLRTSHDMVLKIISQKMNTFF